MSSVCSECIVSSLYSERSGCIVSSLLEGLGEGPLLNCSIGFRYFSDNAFREQVHTTVLQAVESMLDEAGSCPVVVVGHSLGTVICSRLFSMAGSPDVAVLHTAG